MSFIQSIVLEAARTCLQFLLAFIGRDRKMLVLERRSKVLTLFNDLKAAGLRPRDLKAIERTLTSEDK